MINMDRRSEDSCFLHLKRDEFSKQNQAVDLTSSKKMESALPLPGDSSKIDEASSAIQNIKIDIKDILEVFPETQKIVEFVRAFIRQLHLDQHLEKAASFFKQLIVDNEAPLRGLSSQEKAQELFKTYKKFLGPFYEKDPIFINCFSELKAFVNYYSELKAIVFPETELLCTVRKIIDSEVNYLHTGFPLFAISRASKIKIRDITLPGDKATAMNQETNKSLNVSKQALELFQTWFIQAKEPIKTDI